MQKTEQRPGIFEAWIENQKREQHKDASWLFRFEQELEARYIPPSAPALTIASNTAPLDLNHREAKRWLAESRVLPAIPDQVLRAAVVSRAEGARHYESARLLLCRFLGRLVADAAWEGPYDPRILVALFDSEDAELRAESLRLVPRFVGKTSSANLFVERLAFPQRSTDLILAIAKDLEAHDYPLRTVMMGGDERQRRFAFIAMIAGMRMNPKQKCRAFSLMDALDDWDEVIALMAAELLEILPSDHALNKEINFNEWVKFARKHDPQRPAVVARKFRIASRGAASTWLIMTIEDWMLDHTLTRAAVLHYLGGASDKVKKRLPNNLHVKLRELRDSEAKKADPDEALLADLDHALAALSKG